MHSLLFLLVFSVGFGCVAGGGMCVDGVIGGVEIGGE